MPHFLHVFDSNQLRAPHFPHFLLKSDGTLASVITAIIASITIM
jgi:hypothetical protein